MKGASSDNNIPKKGGAFNDNDLAIVTGFNDDVLPMKGEFNDNVLPMKRGKK